MCGITGIWYIDDTPVHGRQIEQFTNTIRHRGPDGQQTYIDKNGSLAFGNSRLAIVDPSERGNQPMSYAEGRVLINYNGEIYNYVEQRDELRRAGYCFRTETDTEVVLAAYHKWGTDCQLKFNGMWAFSIWDTETQTLFLSRDRFGVKPLYVYHDSRRFAFASEVKAFLALEWFDTSFDFNYLAATLATSHYLQSSEETLLRNVTRFAAGHCMTMKKGASPKLVRWWNTLDHLPAIPKDFNEQTLAFRELFDDACRIRVRTVAPVSVSLSGGMDSTSVLATLYHIGEHGTSVHSERTSASQAYLATFNDPTRDERRFADLLIQSLKIPAHYEKVPTAITTDLLDRMLYHAEDPNSIHFANWTIYAAMRRDARYVAMTGDGSDELFVAYPQHIEAALSEALQFVPSQRRFREIWKIQQKMMPEAFQLLEPTAWQPIRNVWQTLSHIYSLAHKRVDPTETIALAGSDQLLLSPSPIKFTSFFQDCKQLAAQRLLMKRLYFDFHYGILPWILNIKDLISMAHGIEIRSPFMDWRVVCFAFALPSSSLIGQGYTKLLLREAMPGRLPEAIRTRTSKISFADSERSLFWQMKHIVQETIHSRAFFESPLWDGKAMQCAIERAYQYNESEHAAFFWKCVKTTRLINTFTEKRKSHVFTLAHHA